MKENAQLGEILVSTGVLTEEQRERATKMAAQTRCLFGEAVLRLGFASEEAVAVALSKQLHVPYASRENKILRVERTQGLDKVIPEAFARDNLVLPLFIEANMLAVAMAEPDNVLLQDNLRVMTRHEIQAFVATKTQVIKAIDDFYQGGGSSVIERTMEARAAGAAAWPGRDAARSRVARQRLARQPRRLLVNLARAAGLGARS